MNVDSNTAVSEFSFQGSRPAVHVIGMDGRGCAGITSEAMQIASRAQVLVGGERHLAFFPQHAGRRIVLAGRISDALDEVARLADEDDVCILASGDPLFFGVASLVLRRLGRENVAILPTVSSMQLAFSRAQMPWSGAKLFSLHGRPLRGVASRLRQSLRAGIFTDVQNSPARIAAHLLEFGEEGWRAVVCERLSLPEERLRRFESLSALADADDVDPLNVLILERKDSSWSAPANLGFMREETFAKKMPRAGLITKREVRALALAQMHLSPESVVWDVGAGSGSVAIEASRLAPEGQVFAVEVDSECAGYCRENIRAHGTDNVSVMEGLAPEALAELPDPEAVFVGGTKGSMQATIGVIVERIKAGGRLVVSAVTLENVARAYEAFKHFELEPEVTLVQCSRGKKLAGYLRYEALNPIHLFSATVGKSRPTATSEITNEIGVHS